MHIFAPANCFLNFVCTLRLGQVFQPTWNQIQNGASNQNSTLVTSPVSAWRLPYSHMPSSYCNPHPSLSRVSAPCFLLLLPWGFWVMAILGWEVCLFTTAHPHYLPSNSFLHHMTYCPSEEDREVVCLQDSKWLLKQHRRSPGMQTNPPITLELPLTLVCVHEGSDGQDSTGMWNVLHLVQRRMESIFLFIWVCFTAVTPEISCGL